MNTRCPIHGGLLSTAGTCDACEAEKWSAPSDVAISDAVVEISPVFCRLLNPDGTVACSVVSHAGREGVADLIRYWLVGWAQRHAEQCAAPREYPAAETGWTKQAFETRKAVREFNKFEDEAEAPR